jgi:triosephosphate isomerase
MWGAELWSTLRSFEAKRVLIVQVVDLTKSAAGKVEVTLIPPHPFLVPVQGVVESTHVSMGSQNVYFEEKGAYTGAVSIDMLQSVGTKYVLCGHSERRT